MRLYPGLRPAWCVVRGVETGPRAPCLKPRASRGRCGAGAGIGRKFVHILDSIICFLGWFLPLVDSKRQTIADKVMSTYVVTGIEKKPFAVDLWLPPKQTTEG